MDEFSQQRKRIVRYLIVVRWITAAALFGLYAHMVGTIDPSDASWGWVPYLLAGYATLNVFFQLTAGTSNTKAPAGTISAIAGFGIITDLAVFFAFLYAAPSDFQTIGFALYMLVIMELGALLSESVVVLVFFVILALYGFNAQLAAAGEVLIERLWSLVPQGFFLGLALVFTMALRRNLARHAAELYQTRQLAEAVVENLGDGIIIFDTERRLLFMNRAAETVLGLKGADLLGLKIRKNISYPIRNIGNLLTVIGTVKQDGDRVEVRIDKPEERLLAVVHMPLRDADRTPYGEMFVVRDITRETFLNKLKSDFISVAAHQLRTPLSSLKWAFSVLADGGLGPLTDDQKPVVDQGMETTDRLVRLVNSLLNVSRMEEGRFGYEFGSVDMALLIAKTIETLKPKAESRNIRIESSVPDMLPPIAADAEKLELVVENFLDNAVSYSQPGGEVHIEAASEGAFLRCTIRDNGVGIPQAQQQLLFTKFFRGDNVVRMQTDGSGLGLYIAKNVVERHGGTINLTSQEGVGTTISFTVPFAK
ncbi:MAG: ATP-binding protein [bacterium]|nr:ATP-binding protein [bacterium]